MPFEATSVRTNLIDISIQSILTIMQLKKTFKNGVKYTLWRRSILAAVIHYSYDHLAPLKHHILPFPKLHIEVRLSPKYTHPSSVPLRLINKSGVLPAALLDYHLFPCGMWTLGCFCSAWCLVSQPGCLASSQETTAYQTCTLRCFIPPPTISHCLLVGSTVSCNSYFFIAESQGWRYGGQRGIVWATEVKD